MEISEEVQYVSSTWLRYVDDVLVLFDTNKSRTEDF